MMNVNSTPKTASERHTLTTWQFPKASSAAHCITNLQAERGICDYNFHYRNCNLRGVHEKLMANPQEVSITLRLAAFREVRIPYCIHTPATCTGNRHYSTKNQLSGATEAIAARDIYAWSQEYKCIYMQSLVPSRRNQLQTLCRDP